MEVVDYTLIATVMLAPIAAMLLIWPIIISKDKKHLLKVLLVFIVAGVSWVAVTTRGAEGPFYRLYTSIIVFVTVIFLLTRFFTGSDTGTIKLRLKVVVVLLLVAGVLLFFSEGVCSPMF